jgi:hypothetical protein
MKLSELIAAVGDDNVAFQNLDQCASSLNYTATSGTKITFLTSETTTLTGTVKLGLVVWLDRDQVKAAVARAVDGGGDA